METSRFARLSQAVREPDDTAEHHLAKVGLVITAAVMSLFGGTWAVAYLLLGRPTAAAIPGGYAVVSSISLALFLVTRRYGIFRFSQILFMLFLPFLLQWVLGGFVYSGAVAAWAFMAIVGALIFHGPNAAIGWFAGYCGLMILSAVFDERFTAGARPFPGSIEKAFFAANLLGLTGLVFVVVRYALLRRQLFSNFLAKEHKETLKALAAANVNSARLISEIEEKNRVIEDAHQQLANSFDEVKKRAALQEIENKRMEAELVTARTVQAMLIPEATNGIRGVDLAVGYRAASECGGDWLGFFDDPVKGEVSVLIGDVTGHGVGSALVTAGVFGYFATLQTLHASDETTHPIRVLSDPTRVLTHLDQVVAEMGKRRTCMTLFATVVDYRHKRVRFSNAGHCPPYLISRSFWEGYRAQGRIRSTHLLTAPGKILGSTPSRNGNSYQDFPSGDLTIGEGDLLFWYTDGLLENRKADGEQLGKRRLLSWLYDLWDQPIDKIKSGLDSRVDEFVRGRPLDDDIAYIVARMK